MLRILRLHVVEPRQRYLPHKIEAHRGTTLRLPLLRLQVRFSRCQRLRFIVSIYIHEFLGRNYSVSIPKGQSITLDGELLRQSRCRGQPRGVPQLQFVHSRSSRKTTLRLHMNRHRPFGTEPQGSKAVNALSPLGVQPMEFVLSAGIDMLSGQSR